MACRDCYWIYNILVIEVFCVYICVFSDYGYQGPHSLGLPEHKDHEFLEHRCLCLYVLSHDYKRSRHELDHRANNPL